MKICTYIVIASLLLSSPVFSVYRLSTSLRSCSTSPVINKYGNTLMHFAVMNNDLPSIKELCKQEPDTVTRKNSLGCSPLFYATKDPQTFKYLLSFYTPEQVLEPNNAGFSLEDIAQKNNLLSIQELIEIKLQQKE